MSMSRGYRLPVKVVQQPRPFGVAILAGLGIIGSLLLSAAALIGIWSLMQISVAPSLQLAVLGLILVVALVVLRINWGFWELLKWAWWANLCLTLLNMAAVVFVLRYVPGIGEAVSRLRPELNTNLVSSVVRGALLGNLALDLIVLVYLVGLHTVFGVGVKDERPLWEKVHRH
jgi:hypothetical protein